MKLDSAVFFTKDIERAVEFYRDKMGFKVEYINLNFASFIFPNEARLGIKTPTKDREIPGHQTVFISTDHIEEELDKIKSNTKLYEELSELAGWGKYFSILDLDGNKVLFIEHEK
ncbi:VOC family protein [candidate division WS5 bacterium]|uniref:VOC family protein n=1 Tax=candidate division WS5 bacterium TaxID=2093353 RepID=A0A419DEC2_9BACT|nr:MAG: VOC family protein [candidate division WS5 bacterium]